MTSITKVDEKLEVTGNFIAWKYRMLLIIEENGLEAYVEKEIAEPEGDKNKEKSTRRIWLRQRELLQIPSRII